MDRADTTLEPKTDWEEVGRITEHAIKTGDPIPWEVVRAWLKSWDSKAKEPALLS